MVLILLHKSQLSLLNYLFSINELLLATKGTWERANWGRKKKKKTSELEHGIDVIVLQ